MIYTGYFAKLKHYKALNLLPISICGKCPNWYDGLEFKFFAPKYSFFKEWKDGLITNEQYVEKFKLEILNQLDKQQIYNYLTFFNQDIILLCYEKSTDFCHRHIVSEWIRNELGLNCEELNESNNI